MTAVWVLVIVSVVLFGTVAAVTLVAGASDPTPQPPQPDDGLEESGSRVNRMVGGMSWLWLIGTGAPNDGRPTRVEDQVPYGDFTPGRFGWLLDDIRSLREPIPVKGRQGLWNPESELVERVLAEVGHG